MVEMSALIIAAVVTGSVIAAGVRIGTRYIEDQLDPTQDAGNEPLVRPPPAKPTPELHSVG